MRKLLNLFLALAFGISLSGIYSCNETETIINDIVSNKVTAKDRLDSAFAQAQRKYSGAKLVMIFGKNVLYSGEDAGKTDISLSSGITDPNNIGAWLYIFKKTGSNELAVYTPDPTPGERDCIELTAAFNFNTLLNLIQDTSARNIVSGALTLINNSNFNISTNKDSLVNSDVAYGYSYSSNPVIRFDSSFTPRSSTSNGSTFLNGAPSGSTNSVNMFLIPALGTLRLDLPEYIQSLVGFPNDLWIVNYKSTSGSTTTNVIFGTVVRSDQMMGISIISGLLSRAINISKF
ncbi:MAG TPA: hypothetical protein VN514_00600 [Ignavibacteria bacterium]|nr:hypothetical protein [Ignavibacteria bacterium]